MEEKIRKLVQICGNDTCPLYDPTLNTRCKLYHTPGLSCSQWKPVPRTLSQMARMYDTPDRVLHINGSRKMEID